MNWISKMYWTCKIRFGTLKPEDLEHLCAIFTVFQEPQKQASWMSLHAWKRVYRQECEELLKLYFAHHTADEGLFKVKWLLQAEPVMHVYLHSLCTRKKPLTSAEEDWILNSNDVSAIRCLGQPMSEQGELRLLNSKQHRMVYNYAVCHIFSDAGEALFAKLASADEQYRNILMRYFEIHRVAYQERVFTSAEAQLALFADERNEELIMQVIEQCDMDNWVLAGEVIRYMATKMDPTYLRWYLAYSFIAEKDLVSELLAMHLPESLRDMIAIAEQRSAIHEMVANSLLYVNDDWTRAEREAYMRFDREDDAEIRMAELHEYVDERFKEGAVSPAMAAWVAARCPSMAKDALLNLTRFQSHVMNKITFVSPLDLHYTGPQLY